MSMTGMANRTVSMLKWTNVIAAIGMAGMLGWFLIASTACSDIMGPGSAAALNRTDSLAWVAILRANNLKYDSLAYAIVRDTAGHIVSINLYDRKVKVLPPEIGDLAYLVRLDLGKNEIAALPKEMEKLLNLQKLFLGGNRLDSIPGGMRFMALTEVELNDNRLTALPENFDVTSVEIMDLAGNLLVTLPPDFRYLTRLRNLDLSRNRLESLTDFSGMGIKVLDLSGNRLSSLPPSLFNLTPTYIQVGSNRLCFQKAADPDSATLSMIAWLDERDRDWKDTQTCP